MVRNRMTIGTFINIIVMVVVAIVTIPVNGFSAVSSNKNQANVMSHNENNNNANDESTSNSMLTMNPTIQKKEMPLKKNKNSFSGGFGSAVTTTGNNSRDKRKRYASTVTATSVTTKLSTKAKKLLQKHSQDVDAACTDYYTTTMNDILQQNNNENDNNRNRLSSEEIHTARVKATWDAVALFLPMDYARTKGMVEPYVQRRLQHIAAASAYHLLSNNNNDDNHRTELSILDVGCGDGALIPYLMKYHGNNKMNYVGIDLSNEMIELGRRQYPQHNFIIGSFPNDCCIEPNNENKYDVIIFNGSMQFFQNTQQTILDAIQLLKNDRNCLILLAHVEGSKFVQQECRSNPKVAVRAMPNIASLQQYANLFNLNILSKQDLLVSSVAAAANDDVLTTIYDPQLDGNDEQFYLVGLETR